MIRRARSGETREVDFPPRRCSCESWPNRIDITLDDGGSSSLLWATKNEWLGLLDVAGLELEALFGGFDGRPFDDDSNEYVFIARRPA